MDSIITHQFSLDNAWIVLGLSVDDHGSSMDSEGLMNKSWTRQFKFILAWSVPRLNRQIQQAEPYKLGRQHQRINQSIE